MRVSERLAHVAASLRDAGCGLKDAGRCDSCGFGFTMENSAYVSHTREWNGLNASLSRDVAYVTPGSPSCTIRVDPIPSRRNLMPRHTILPAVLAALFCLPLPCLAEDPPTWTEIDGTVYGAKPDGRGPIGGGEGYVNIVTEGDFTANDLDSLLDALSKAKAGQVVFIPGEAEIDLTARIYIEKLAVVVPEGVTLAGDRGHNGSKGAVLTSDALKTRAIIRAGGPDVRVTGFADSRTQWETVSRSSPPGVQQRRRGTCVLLQVSHFRRCRYEPSAAGSGQLRDLRLRPRRHPAP